MLDTLSVRSVERLAPADDAYEVRDRKTRGFLIRGQPTGVKTWYCDYRRGQRVRIGRVDLITPTEARAQAVKLLPRGCGALFGTALLATFRLDALVTGLELPGNHARKAALLCQSM